MLTATKTRDCGDRDDHQSRRHSSRRQAFRIHRIRCGRGMPDQPQGYQRRRGGQRQENRDLRGAGGVFAPGTAKIAIFLPLTASATLMSLGLIGHPAAASYSVDLESLPSGRVSPTLMVISVSAVSSFRRRLASRSWAAKSKCLPVPRRLAIFPAMQTAAEAIQDHRLTLSEVLHALVAEGLV